jgi:hypothetical protein
MPTFRSQPSSDLASSIRRAVASRSLAGNEDAINMQADQAAAVTAQHLGLAEKARAEAEALRNAETARSDPKVATEFASRSSGLTDAEGTRLMGHIRGTLEQPSSNDDLDASMAGREAQPFRMEPPNVSAGQRRGFESALASTIANRIATGHTNAEQLAKSGQDINKTAVQNAATDAGSVPEANKLIAAITGKVREPFKMTAQGAILNEETGDANENTATGRAVRANLAAQTSQRNAAAGGATGGGLSPEAIEMMAREGLKDKGALANVGRGVQGARDLRAVLNRMAEVAANDGGPGMAQRRQEFRADANSLNKMTSSYDAITAFEKNAVRNGDSLVQLGKKVDATGVPVIEKWIRAGRQATGDADVAEFHAQMMLYRAEAARILVNPNLTGQLTDSARHEVEEFLKGNASAPQIERVVNRLKTDFDNRKKTLEEQMDEARKRMTGGSPGVGAPGSAQPAAPAAANAKGWKLMRDAKGNQAYVSPDGKQFEEVK